MKEMMRKKPLLPEAFPLKLKGKASGK